MRASTTFCRYSLAFLYLSVFVAAWPWPRWLPELDSLVVRQDSGSSSSSSTSAKPTATPPPSSGTSSVKSVKNTSSGATKDSHSTTSVNGTSSTKKATHTTFDPQLPAGGISMITPSVLAGSQYYKVGDKVTFAWNYTSLLATPTAINIMATCTANQQLYTLASNQTVGDSTGAVTWDTGAYQSTALSAPLLTETYTLIIYDADAGISATAEAGYLAVYSQYAFGMYTPQPYKDKEEYICVTCSGALSDMERRALGMVVGVSVITVLSFTWFVGGLGVVW